MTTSDADGPDVDDAQDSQVRDSHVDERRGGRGAADAEVAGPSFGRSIGLFWLYTVLRFGLFGVLWFVIWLSGAGWFVGAVIALALSIPLSWFLLARPRAALAANIEQRVNARVVRKADYDARLAGDDLTGENGVIGPADERDAGDR